MNQKRASKEYPSRLFMNSAQAIHFFAISIKTLVKAIVNKVFSSFDALAFVKQILVSPLQLKKGFLA